MKKLILSLMLFMGLSFNANAFDLTSFVIPTNFLMIAYAASEVEYEACNNDPYRTVMRKGTNFYFDVSECDYQKYKDNYK